VCDDLVDLSDFFPTLAEAAGTRPPPGTARDGRSFLAQLLGRPATPREWVYISHWVYPDALYQAAVRSRRWKLHSDGRLYDVLADPWEERPLPRHAESEEALRARLQLRAAMEAVEKGEDPSRVQEAWGPPSRLGP
jgi:arylsulfatase A